MRLVKGLLLRFGIKMEVERERERCLFHLLSLSKEADCSSRSGGCTSQSSSCSCTSSSSCNGSISGGSRTFRNNNGESGGGVRTGSLQR